MADHADDLALSLAEGAEQESPIIDAGTSAADMRREGSDVPAVRAFLSHRFGEVEDFAPIAGGEWSRAFGFRAGGRDLVARFGSSIDDYEKDRVAASWSLDHLPVPQVLEVGEAFDGAYAVSERVSGVPMKGLEANRWRKVVSIAEGALDGRVDGWRARTRPKPGSTPGNWGQWALRARNHSRVAPIASG